MGRESLLPSLTQLNGEGCQGVNSEFWPMDRTSKNSVVYIQNVVHFALNSEQLSPISQRILDQLISILKQYPLIDMTLLGYTDSRASSAYNLNLAQRRIQAVQNYLTQSGIEASRIQSEAKGEKDLESDPNIYMQHAKSRRVVLELNDEVVHIQTEPQWQDLQLEKVLKEIEGEPK